MLLYILAEMQNAWFIASLERGDQTSQVPSNKIFDGVSEVQRFVGWAIHSLEDRIGRTDCVDENAEYNKEESLKVLHEMHLSHYQAIGNKEYLEKYYSESIQNLNMGGMALVSAKVFPWGRDLVKTIYNSYTFDTLDRYGNKAASVAWEQVKSDKRLESLFDSIPFNVSNRFIKRQVQEQLTFKVFNARSCETLRQYKERTTDRGAKDGCALALRTELEAQSISKKRTQETVEDGNERSKKTKSK